MGCKHLDQVCLIEEVIIHETAEALLLNEWENDMKEEIDSINQDLPNVYAGVYEIYEDGNGNADVNLSEGEKTRAIQEWIGRVLQKIIRYKVEHYRLLSLAAAALAHASPNGVVIESTLSFLQLPDHVFEGEGDKSATTPAFDRHLWENVVEMEQRAIERDRRMATYEHQVAEAGEATGWIEGSFDPSKKRPKR